MNRRDLLVRGAGAGFALAFPGWLSAAADPRLKSLAAAVRGPVLARGASGYDARAARYSTASTTASIRWRSCSRSTLPMSPPPSSGRRRPACTSSPARAATATAATRRGRRRGRRPRRSWPALPSRGHAVVGGAPGSGTSTTVSPRTGSRFPRGRARASASAAMHSAAASGSPRVPGGSPPTISSRCRSSPPTARCSSQTRTTTPISSGPAAAAAAATSGS